MSIVERPELAGKKIALAIGGSIAAHKAITLCRELQAAGAEVRCVLSRTARRFVGTYSLSGLGPYPVLTDMFDGAPGERHLELAAWADLLAIVPTTADALARLAHGHAATLTDALFLCIQGPVVLAPAMHTHMFDHPLVQHNLQRLSELPHVHIVGPVHGKLASGELGLGRMSEPSVIVEAIAACWQHRDLQDQRLMITAGATVEAIDPVRFLSNRSSGKMGFALAQRALRRGAQVTLISGPVALPPPGGARFIPVRTALEMQQALLEHAGPALGNLDALLMAAAVSDYRVSAPSATKLERSAATLELELVPNPDILRELATRRHGAAPVLIGFALQTQSGPALLAKARRKLVAKKVDLIVANGSAALEADRSRANLVERTKSQPLPELTKAELADRILDWLSRRLERRPRTPSNRKAKA